MNEHLATVERVAINCSRFFPVCQVRISPNDLPWPFFDGFRFGDDADTATCNLYHVLLYAPKVTQVHFIMPRTWDGCWFNLNRSDLEISYGIWDEVTVG